jgi:hypothetical protein
MAEAIIPGKEKSGSGVSQGRIQRSTHFRFIAEKGPSRALYSRADEREISDVRPLSGVHDFEDSR